MAMKKKILVVDDNESMREILQEWLELQGYETETAKDGQEGMMLLKKSFDDFDLVITDFRMPKLNGIELIRWVKQRGQNKKIILLSGDDMRLVYPAAKNAGADKVISKDFNFSLHDISRTIQELLVQ